MRHRAMPDPVEILQAARERRFLVLARRDARDDGPQTAAGIERPDVARLRHARRNITQRRSPGAPHEAVHVCEWLAQPLRRLARFAVLVVPVRLRAGLGASISRTAICSPLRACTRFPSAPRTGSVSTIVVCGVSAGSW